MKYLFTLFVLCLVVYPRAAQCSPRYQDECIADMAWVETRGAQDIDKWYSIRTVLNRVKHPKEFGRVPCDIIRRHRDAQYEFQWAKKMPKIPRNHPIYRELLHLVSVVRNTPPKGCEKDVLFFRSPGYHTGVKNAHLCKIGDMYYFSKKLEDKHAHHGHT